jgi:guanylate kinase
MTLNLRSKGLILVISSPSGGGKSSLTQAILQSEESFVKSISVTTRLKRPGEIDGEDYYFISLKKFNSLLEQNELIEWTQIYDNFYGSLRKNIEEFLDKGVDIIFDIDWHGAREIKKQKPKETVTIFLLPPNIEILQKRLKERGQDSQEVIEKRIKNAPEEIKHSSEYDYVIINDDFKQAYKEIKNILIFERKKRLKPSL